MLHTDQLEKEFGKVAAKILDQNERRRSIFIIDEKEIPRTYAVTFYNQHIGNDNELNRIRDEIKSGGLIGKTIQKYGCNLEKNILSYGKAKLPSWLKNAFETSANYSWYRMYNLYIVGIENTPLLFGTLCEIDHPVLKKEKVNNKKGSIINLSSYQNHQALDDFFYEKIKTT